jgi:hypothetical protein
MLKVKGIPWSTEYTECMPGFLSIRPNWVHPLPILQESVAPLPFGSKGGRYTQLGVGGGERTQSDDGTDTLVYSTVYCKYTFNSPAPTEPAAVKIWRRASTNVMNE